MKKIDDNTSESVLENLEKMAKEMGLSKSALISVALKTTRKVK